MKQPGALVWKGKVAGGLFGLLAGPFGIFLGFLIGHLVDLIIESARIRKEVRRFLADPAGSPLAAWEGGMYSFLCLAGAICMARGWRVKSRDKELIEWLGVSYPVRDHDLKYLQEILDGMEDLEEALGLKGHAETVRKGRSDVVPEELLARLVALAGEDGHESLQGPVMTILEGIAGQWGMDLGMLGLPRRGVSPYEDAWEVLGLKPGSSLEEVKRVFRILAAQFHPDGGAALSEIQRRETEEAFKRIRLAYEECTKRLTCSAG